MTIRSDDPRLRQLLDRLDLETKVRLLTGRDFWTTHPAHEIGLSAMLLSDGPAGVRGEFWDERDPSLNLPSGSALGASWDTGLAERYGAVAAIEARRKGVHVVLGPTINLHRSPLGGRHFEALSEDPLLTGALAAAYVRGVQDAGVAATPKHYVANDSETDRFTVDVRVSDRALRELYLAPFERAVRDADAWAVMSSYNAINGTTATENDLLENPLNTEWGFDGVVVSDWTAVRSVASAAAAQDLVMPGPDGPWGEALVAAVRAGQVSEDAIDRKVLRLLALAARVGALVGFERSGSLPSVDGRAFAREAAVSGAVLLHNDGVLPLGVAPRRIAVIGDLAERARTQGGGSATVLPDAVVSPLDGIRAAFPDSDVRFARGAIVQAGLSDIPVSELADPVTGLPGTRVRMLDADGQEIFSEHRTATRFVWIGGPAPIIRTATVEARTTWTPTTSGVVALGFAGVGEGEVTVDGELLFAARAEQQGDDLGAALLSPGVATHPLEVVAGRAIDLAVTFRREITGPLAGALAFGFGLDAAAAGDDDSLLTEAEALARESDLVVLVVGTSAEVESEGFDRADLRLPGRQDALADRVLAANPNTVVVVTAGAPVELPWRERAAAVLLTWFGGQEIGHALGDMLTGRAEPGGRLPTTWPAALADVPVSGVTPRDGVLDYTEGVHIGYRAWLRAGTRPAYPFGFGLGYTTWQIESIEAPAEVTLDSAAEVRVVLTNTGERAGDHVIQIYAERTDSAMDRPVRWLVGFARVHAGPASSATATVRMRGRELAYWDGGWRAETGKFRLLAGSSVDDLGPSTSITLA